MLYDIAESFIFVIIRNPDGFTKLGSNDNWNRLSKRHVTQYIQKLPKGKETNEVVRSDEALAVWQTFSREGDHGLTLHEIFQR